MKLNGDMLPSVKCSMLLLPSFTVCALYAVYQVQAVIECASVSTYCQMFLPTFAFSGPRLQEECVFDMMVKIGLSRT